MSCRPIVLALLLLAQACGSGPRPAVEAGVALPTPASNPAPVPGDATGPRDAAEPISDVPAPSLPKFYLINRLGYPSFSLFKLGDEAIATGGTALSVLSDSGISQDTLFPPGDAQNLPASVLSVAGEPRGEMWAALERTDGVVTWGELYRKTKHGWKQQGQSLPPSHVYRGISNWKGGRVLTLVGADWMVEQQASFRFSLVSGPQAPLPRLSMAEPVLEPDDECAGVTQLQIPEQFAALPSGDVFVAGWRCDDGLTVIEHFAPNDLASRVHVIPDSTDWSERKLVAHADRQVALFASRRGKAVLARFDGTNWLSEKLGLHGTFVDADAAPDGTLVVVTFGWDPQRGVDLPGQLWWRPPNQTRFSQLVVPQGEPLEHASQARLQGVSAVAALSQDDIWVVSGGSLYHTRASPIEPPTIDTGRLDE